MSFYSYRQQKSLLIFQILRFMTSYLYKLSAQCDLSFINRTWICCTFLSTAPKMNQITWQQQNTIKSCRSNSIKISSSSMFFKI